MVSSSFRDEGIFYLLSSFIQLFIHNIHKFKAFNQPYIQMNFSICYKITIPSCQIIDRPNPLLYNPFTYTRMRSRIRSSIPFVFAHFPTFL